MENEKDYVRVLPARSGNNGGNKMKLRTGIGSNREVEREKASTAQRSKRTFIQDNARRK